MDAQGILAAVGEAFFHAKLDAVMIGNAAAAIQGAPVTTMDIDFCVPDDEDIPAKLSGIAVELKAQLLDCYPFFQIQAPSKELYLDFICNVVGVDSFGGLKERSMKVSFDDIYTLQIACLEDIIRSKTAAGGEKDLAVLPILKRTLEIKREIKKDQDTQE